MKQWLTLSILFCFCSIGLLKAQSIVAEADGVQAKLLIECYVAGKKIPISGQSLSFSPLQVNKDADLKVYLKSTNSPSIAEVIVRCKQTPAPVGISVNGVEVFYPNINPGGGTWNFTISANGKVLKEHVLTYSITGSTKQVTGTDKATTTTQIDTLQVAWLAAQKSNRIEGYKSFLKKHPKSVHTAEANKAIQRLTPLSGEVTDVVENTYTIHIGPVLGSAPYAKILGDTNKISFEKLNGKALSYQTKLPLEDSKIYTLSVFDPGRSNDESTLDLVIDNTFRIETISETESRKIKLSGGKGPYQAQFISKNGAIKTIPIKENPWVISIAALSKDLEPGQYDIKLNDAHLNDAVALAIAPITIPAKPVGFDWQQLIPYVLGTIAFLAILLVISSQRKRKLKKRIEAAKAKMKQNLEETTPALTPETTLISEEPVEPVIHPITITKEPSAPLAEPHVANDNDRKGFVIRAKVENADEILAESEYFQTIIHSAQYHMIPLSHLWANSAISHLYFSPVSVKVLDEFLWSDNLNLVQTKGANIPEIGGMLLGRCAVDSQKNTYVVAVERFVPIKARFQNVYQLAFDPLSIATEVSRITDEYPEYRIMGWFHTHPGHGLFLSKQDLEIQGHYREPYHFAMEIDSLSDKLDTAFFTRTKEGTINNHEHLLAEASWFSWKDIKNHQLSN